MAKANRKNQKEAISLDEFYTRQLGERWDLLKTAMLDSNSGSSVPAHLAERWNRFSSTNQLRESQGKENPDNEQFRLISESKELERDSENLLTSYIMDPASIYAANALGVQSGDRVLDMCAAPGGKTLILAEAIGEDGELQANEVSEARRERLKKVLQQYIPLAKRQNIWVTGKEGGLFAKSHEEYFDRILVDAPCSGEKYLVNSPSEVKDWSPHWSEKLAQRQYALLTAALIALKPQGEMVYSTCAISHLENDEVVRKLLAKKKNQFEVMPLELPVDSAEKTEFGIRFWPDRSHWGPIYYCKMRKLS